MSLVMLDSSVWIDYLRNRSSAIAEDVNLLLNRDLVCICGVVEMELLQGIRSAKEAALIKELFSALHYIDMQRKDFIDAGNRLRALRQNGITIPPSDCLIAVQCKSSELALFTLDKDFDHFSDLKRYRAQH